MSFRTRLTLVAAAAVGIAVVAASVVVYIGYLRRKTESGGKPRLIHTVRGVGYALRET